MLEPWIILDRQALERIPEILRGTKSHLEWGGVSFRINNTTRKAMPTKPCGNIIAEAAYLRKNQSIFLSVMTL